MRIVCLCALTLAVSASACAATPPPSHSITLDVQAGSSGGSNQQVYSCTYSGGTGNGGDVTFTGRGATTVVVHLTGDRKYTIDDVSFPSDPNDQLSNGPSPSPTSAVIQDKNDQEQTATYRVTVKDPNGATIPCDPQIINH